MTNNIVDCCKLVGNIDIFGECWVSVDINSQTELGPFCETNEFVIGPTTVTLSLSSYAKNAIHVGCPGKATVSLPWLKKIDCENALLYFLYNKTGSASIYGDVEELATLLHPASSHKVWHASSASGPYSIYTEDIQYNGFGLKYDGEPITFNTETENGVTLNIDFLSRVGLDVVDNKMYLQNFNLSMEQGQVPMASYSFVGQLKED